MNYLKKTFAFIALSTLIMSCETKKDAYTLQGEVSGNADGKKVYLYKAGEAGYGKAFDSTVIKNNKFIFKGKLEQPQKVDLIIDNNPKTTAGNPENWLKSTFYLENADIQYRSNMATMPGLYAGDNKITEKPTITGSKVQDDYKDFENLMAPRYKVSGELFDEYLKVYHQPAISGVFNTQKGIEIVKKMEAERNTTQKMRFDFIKKHPQSPVAFDLVNESLQYIIEHPYTPAQVDELVGALNKERKSHKNMAQLEQLAKEYKGMTLGTEILNFQAMDVNGNKVNVADYLKPNQYTFLEFWASWCGPCRGEIPHLKHIAKDYKGKNIQFVSISLDEKKEDWQKALKEESMGWPQLLDPNNFNGEVSKHYKITGIPFSILVGPDKKIVDIGLRGAALDAKLQEIIK